MEIRVGVFGHVVVDNDVDTLNVHTAAKHIRGDKDAALEALEVGVVLDSEGLDESIKLFTAPPASCCRARQ